MITKELERSDLSTESILENRDLLNKYFIAAKFGDFRANLEYIIGIPTVYRDKENYLTDTLDQVEP